MKNPLRQMGELGQSFWMDNLTRQMVASGRLSGWIADDGLSGITSNPKIFKDAISAGAADYDDDIRRLADQGLEPLRIYERMAVEDVRRAADVLREVHDASGGTDGFVSLEVSPHLARDTQGSVEEAVRLWEALDRPNVLIKIPGTAEGVPAIETCLARGININVTLLFSREMYRRVMQAYLSAVEARIERGERPAVASVASFFLSRIDSKVDARLERIGGAESERARALRGKTAVANAKLAYQDWRSLFSGERWERLARAGARVQKPLWASTSTKNPDYRDVLYVESLIGPDTINTMPEETADAFRDHGRVARTVDRDVEEARHVLDEIESLGIHLDAVCEELVTEGIRKFVEPFDEMLATLDEKRRAMR